MGARGAIGAEWAEEDEGAAIYIYCWMVMTPWE